MLRAHSKIVLEQAAGGAPSDARYTEQFGIRVGGRRGRGVGSVALARALPLMLAVGAVFCSGGVDARTLRVSYYSGAKHPMIESGINFFMEEVRKADPSIDFKVFPAGQLGKPADSVRALQSGLADIGQVVVTYHREEMPLSNVINLPWDGAD